MKAPSTHQLLHGLPWLPYLHAGHVAVRLPPVGEHLPEEHAEAPDVAGRAELAEVDGLGGVPGEQGTSSQDKSDRYALS